MKKQSGIWTATSKQFYHSTRDIVPSYTTIPMVSDTYLDNRLTTTNFDSSSALSVGGYVNVGSFYRTRALLKPDFSTLSAGRTFASASLNITPITDETNFEKTMVCYRVLRNVVSNQTTWNIWKTSNNWGTAGCNDSANDYDGAVLLGSMVIPASPTLNTPMSMTLDPIEFQKLYDGTYTNNGIVLFILSEVANTRVYYASTEHATASYHPTITIES